LSRQSKISAAPTDFVARGDAPARLGDCELTHQQWQQRVEAARRRSESFGANTRTPGDIVSTHRGLVVFAGPREEQQTRRFPVDPETAGAAVAAGWYLVRRAWCANTRPAWHAAKSSILKKG